MYGSNREEKATILRPNKKGVRLNHGTELGGSVGGDGERWREGGGVRRTEKGRSEIRSMKKKVRENVEKEKNSVWPCSTSDRNQYLTASFG